MLRQTPSAPQPARRFGVGIDTSRYGHYAVFLRDDLQPAVDELAFAEDAGLKRTDRPARKEVTAACEEIVAESAEGDERPAIDFAHLKRQVPMERVLDHLGLLGRLRGAGPQRRCPCPIHRGDARGRTFSVNLDENVFQCFDPKCGKKGDVIDLWSCVKGMSLREAARDPGADVPCRAESGRWNREEERLKNG